VRESSRGQGPLPPQRRVAHVGAAPRLPARPVDELCGTFREAAFGVPRSALVVREPGDRENGWSWARRRRRALPGVR
jgi:hypothetical protein